MSLLATPPDAEDGLDRGATVAQVDRLHVLHHVRAKGLDGDHVAALAELGGQWPPLLVWAERPESVIDGAHRLAAAKRLGHRTVAVTRFYGSIEDAFVQSIHSNVEHGLPLALQDRLRAGRRILRRHPDWSDRRLGEVCALAAGTVARLRKELAASPPIVAVGTRAGPGASTGPAVRTGADTRIGKDGRVRPLQPGILRQRIVDALADNPNGSLRAIAAEAGASPETVRRVRMDLDSRPDLPPTERHRARLAEPPPWRADLALTSRAELGELLEWFERTEPGDDPYHYVTSVPLSRVYEMADEARRRATFWNEVAREFEGRARGTGCLRA
jgi:hypothetical protein